MLWRPWGTGSESYSGARLADDPPPAAKNKGKERKVKEEGGKVKGKPPAQKELKPDAGGEEEPGLAELEPDLDIKYAKALKNMFQAAGTASVWAVNNFHHVMSYFSSAPSITLVRGYAHSCATACYCAPRWMRMQKV